MKIRHRTSYSYRTPVALNPHRLLLRPREGIEVHVREFSLTIRPEPTLAWAEDVFGNAVATATFSSMTDHLLIDSEVELDVASPPWPVFDIAHSALFHPFDYSHADRQDLGGLLEPQRADDPDDVVGDWARGFVAGRPTDTLALLRDINFGIHRSFSYQSRDDEGTQTPRETIARGWGACRDFAVLFVEAARRLGLGARLVSGYHTDMADPGSRVQTTHAWAEVFLPGGGWIPFDPTNGAMGGFNLVPVSVGRSMDRIMPVSGSFVGMSDAFLGMKIDVSVAG